MPMAKKEQKINNLSSTLHARGMTFVQHGATFLPNCRNDSKRDEQRSSEEEKEQKNKIDKSLCIVKLRSKCRNQTERRQKGYINSSSNEEHIQNYGKRT